MRPPGRNDVQISSACAKQWLPKRGQGRFYAPGDTDAHRVFVYQEWSHRKGQPCEGGSERIEPGTLWQRSVTHQDWLL